MNTLDIIMLFLAAMTGGAINSVAGGGTFLVFPMLMFSGLSPIQANVTSTIALWPGSVASTFAYKREWSAQKEMLPALMVISIVGAGLGAWVLLTTPEQIFEKLVPWLLLAATLIFTFGRFIIARLPFIRRPAVARAMQFGIAFYGGYFGAGIGILMLAMLQLMGLSNIHRMNALKAWLGSAINAVSVVMFVLSGMVVWSVAWVMIAGAVIGGYFGAAVAQKFPPEPVRWFVSAIGVAMTIYFFMK